MRILLQQTGSGLYFRDVGSWVASGSEAMDFISSTVAIEFCATNRITGVQLVLKFEEDRYDIVLPMRNPADSSSTRPSRSL